MNAMAQNAEKSSPSLTDRVAAARATAMQAAREAEAQRNQAYVDAFNRASERLKALVKVELGVDQFPDPVNFHKEYSHGSPEADYSVIKLDPYWFALRLESDPARLEQEPLLGLIHCPNGHVNGLEYPTTE